ncbi:hypothetical protein EJ997_10270 [Flaviflexus ciconiae]|uniref:Phage tail protein n=1 Tax=Flaviflexus ciconiae TaxID=2496867 RepID=A0A3Q9G7V5_9ACTO|nr:hypothetical protein [Flaviflexus ciconiae]AZQ77668.1 hypothetical protein EJ997_10270 [Flaviflexus ciconiae]
MAEGTSAILAGAPVDATGGVLTAPIGTTGPTSAIDAIADFIKTGFVGEDGITKTVDASDEKIKAWGGSTVKIVRSEHSVTYAFTFLESANATVLKLIHGEENVIITPPTADHGGQVEIRERGELIERQEFVFDMKDGKTRIREFVPDGQLSHTGDVQFVHSAIISYTVTIEAFPDGDGVKAYSYMDDGATTAA